MHEKYAIFVSSTYEDLKEYRELVIKAVLEMGHFPVGMEMFSAADEQQWTHIKRQIDDSDYYLLIIAHRYGSMDGDISYTEKEYDYAILRGIPVLGFIIDDTANWPNNLIDKESSKLEKIRNFKAKVKQKLVSFWTNRDDLYAKGSIALVKQINTTPRVGWVRASESIASATTNELARLSNENEEFRKKIESISLESERVKEERIRQIISIMEKNYIKIPVRSKKDNEFKEVCEGNLYDLFKIIALEISTESTQLKIEMCVAVQALAPKIISSGLVGIGTNIIPTNYFEGWMSDFSILGLVEQVVIDKYNYVNNSWKLTDFGYEVYRIIRFLEMVDGEPRTYKSFKHTGSLE
jgi:hypothetical protein